MNKWIKISDRPPETVGQYLGYGASIIMVDFRDGRWKDYCRQSSIDVSITHWMPLPDPPLTD